MTPVWRQYLRIKQRYPNAILFFRMGDFYETFQEDAETAARELEITLTSRPMGKGLRVPLAGIPYHAVDHYLAKLVGRGYKVALCEQTSDPKKSRGLVEREVVRVVSPGTVVEPALLEGKSNNYLAALTVEGERAGLAYIDITTSEFATAQLALAELAAQLERLQPAELLVAEGMEAPDSFSGAVTQVDQAWFDPELAQELLLEHFGVATLEGFGCGRLPLAIAAAGAILRYLRETQRAALAQITRLSTYSTEAHMTLDAQTRRNLELFQGGRLGLAQGSLLSILDLTKTSMAGRLLKRWLGQPLLELGALERRQEGVAWLHDHHPARRELEALLGRVADLERLANRVRGDLATPRELAALRRSLELLPQVRAALEQAEAKAPAEGTSLSQVIAGLKPCDDVVQLIGAALGEDPPATLAEGQVIRAGFSPELDQLRAASRDAKEYLASLERKERERTGIKSLKVGYNKVFGYYIEVSNAHRRRVPPDYLRKQTLVGAERYFTPQLKEQETTILNAQERIDELESALFHQVCQQVGAAAERILTVAAALAELDVLASLAEAAARYRYVRPRLTQGDEIHIVGGRHPVVEQALAVVRPGPSASLRTGSAQGEGFVPNDTQLSNREHQILVLTGPNMSGKSTYLRQVALIVLMAQMGSFVPAQEATLGLVDRIFTRVGAQDDLAAGQSTFMVEMVETAAILNHATPRSLLVFDEIGRGTSTYDGISIARAVVEYLHNHPRLGAKTLFATHYHELTELAQLLPRVKNFHFAVAEEEGRVVFLRRLVPGGADKSYGIHVAQLAGLPRPVIGRAQEILAHLEGARITDGVRPMPGPSTSPSSQLGTSSGRDPGRGRRAPRQEAPQLTLFPAQPALLEELAKLDIDAMSPLEAITKLYQLQQKARTEG